jgi:hypothetical protein
MGDIEIIGIFPGLSHRLTEGEGPPDPGNETAAPTAIGNGGKSSDLLAGVAESYGRLILDAIALLIDPNEFDPVALGALVELADLLDLEAAR